MKTRMLTVGLGAGLGAFFFLVSPGRTEETHGFRPPEPMKFSDVIRDAAAARAARDGRDTRTVREALERYESNHSPAALQAARDAQALKGSLKSPQIRQFGCARHQEDSS